MVRMGFSLEGEYSIPLSRLIMLIRENGFSAVSPSWSPELDLKELFRLVENQGMEIQSLHAHHKNITKLWEPGTETAGNVLKNIMLCQEDCQRFGIPILVIHGWQGLGYIFPDTPLDYRYFDQIVEHAQKLGIRIAFENLEGEEYLAALMARYDLPCVGFCFDSGHDHCYPHKADFLDAYGHRLIMTHLNDNLGVRDPGGIHSKFDDLHFLPGDGSLDWNRVTKRLAKAAPQRILNFELKKVSKSKDPIDLIYAPLSLEEYLIQAGEKAGKIAAMYSALICK